jgi:hypothetical protein
MRCEDFPPNSCDWLTNVSQFIQNPFGDLTAVLMIPDLNTQSGPGLKLQFDEEVSLWGWKTKCFFFSKNIILRQD